MKGDEPDEKEKMGKTKTAEECINLVKKNVTKAVGMFWFHNFLFREFELLENCYALTKPFDPYNVTHKYDYICQFKGIIMIPLAESKNNAGVMKL